MGDRVHKDESNDKRKGSKTKASEKSRRQDDGGGRCRRRRGASATTGILGASDDLDLISAQDQESQAAYEEMLAKFKYFEEINLETSFMGSRGNLFILKDDNLRDPDRQKEIAEVIGKVDTETFTSLVNLAKRMTDFGTSGDMEGGGNEDMQDDEGVAVVFDDDDESDGDRLEEESDEEDEEVDEGDEGRGISSSFSSGAGTVGDEGAASGGGLAARDVDAHWLQRKLAVYYTDATKAVSLAKEVLSALQLGDERACENALVGLLDYDKFDLVKLLLSNRTKIQYCTRLRQAQSESEKQEITAEMSTDLESDGPALLKELESSVQEVRGRFASKAREGVREFQMGNNNGKGLSSLDADMDVEDSP